MPLFVSVLRWGRLLISNSPTRALHIHTASVKHTGLSCHEFCAFRFYFLSFTRLWITTNRESIKNKRNTLWVANVNTNLISVHVDVKSSFFNKESEVNFAAFCNFDFTRQYSGNNVTFCRNRNFRILIKMKGNISISNVDKKAAGGS